jgi:ATP-dependent Lon protease
MADAPSVNTLPSELPLVALRRTVAFPLTLQPLAVNRPLSVEAVNQSLTADRMILLVLQKSDEDEPGPEDLALIGTVGIIRQMARAPQGLNIIVEGIARVRVDLVTRQEQTLRARITAMPEAPARAG